MTKLLPYPKKYLPTLFVSLLALLMCAYGAIPQLSHYHEFADQKSLWGIPHAYDVLSNLPFLFAALFGMPFVMQQKKSASDFAYIGFAFCLLLTFAGSSYYHWAPDDARLFWDRLPIALACVMLIAAVRFEHVAGVASPGFAIAMECILLCAAAVATVIWWQRTGDLRWYLGLQVLAIVLIPLWHWIYSGKREIRRAYLIAILLYALAKLCELADAQILHTLQMISGHSLKHILAAASGACILYGVRRNLQA